MCPVRTRHQLLGTDQRFGLDAGLDCDPHLQNQLALILKTLLLTTLLMLKIYSCFLPPHLFRFARIVCLISCTVNPFG